MKADKTYELKWHCCGSCPNYDAKTDAPCNTWKVMGYPAYWDCPYADEFDWKGFARFLSSDESMGIYCDVVTDSMQYNIRNRQKGEKYDDLSLSLLYDAWFQLAFWEFTHEEA
jgi:hypothetical protein